MIMPKEKLFSPQKPALKWTMHVKGRMRFYGLSESRVKRVIAHPERAEAGIAPKTTAVMQPITKKGKITQEIWVMYQDKKTQRTIITAWRYPGKSPVRETIPIPGNIRDELQREGYLT